MAPGQRGFPRAAHPVAEVRDVTVVEPSDEVEFDVIITEVIEQPPAASEEDLNGLTHRPCCRGPEGRRPEVVR
jgi:hypothetical protein